MTRAFLQSQNRDQNSRLKRAVAVRRRGPNLMFLIEGQLLAKKEVFGSKYGATSGQGLLKANTVGEGINKDREEGGKELEEARDLAHECSGLRRSHPRLGRCHLREMPLTVVVDREDRITISHAGDGDPLLFEDGINALLAE